MCTHTRGGPDSSSTSAEEHPDTDGRHRVRYLSLYLEPRPRQGPGVGGMSVERYPLDSSGS